MIAAAWTAFKGSKIALYLAIAGAVVWGLLMLVGKLMGAGRSQEKAAQAQRNAETQRRITDADAAGPRTADDVDERLRDGKF